MKVSELIAFLKTQPQHLVVVYKIHSEQAVMESKDIKIIELCQAREDGWVQNKRPDMPSQTYLCFPGN